jgi:hypothetical protein
MTPVLIARLVALGCPPAFAKPLLAVVAAIALIGAVWGAMKLHDHRVIDNHEAKIERRAAPATDKAATERANDTIANAKNDQERHDAINAQPDQPIAPTSRALACARLRQRGHAPASCR